jgi:hypothetical protein
VCATEEMESKVATNKWLGNNGCKEKKEEKEENLVQLFQLFSFTEMEEK